MSEKEFQEKLRKVEIALGIEKYGKPAPKATDGTPPREELFRIKLEVMNEFENLYSEIAELKKPLHGSVLDGIEKDIKRLHGATGDYAKMFRNNIMIRVPNLLQELKRLRSEIAKRDAQMEKAVVIAEAGECGKCSSIFPAITKKGDAICHETDEKFFWTTGRPSSCPHGQSRLILVADEEE